MLVISSREFRSNQKAYLDRVDQGEEILIQRGKDKSYKITPVGESDSCMSEKDYYAKIDRSIQQATEGKTVRINNIDDFRAMLGL